MPPRWSLPTPTPALGRWKLGIMSSSLSYKVRSCFSVPPFPMTLKALRKVLGWGPRLLCAGHRHHKPSFPRYLEGRRLSCVSPGVPGASRVDVHMHAATCQPVPSPSPRGLSLDVSPACCVSRSLSKRLGTPLPAGCGDHFLPRFTGLHPHITLSCSPPRVAPSTHARNPPLV